MSSIIVILILNTACILLACFYLHLVKKNNRKNKTIKTYFIYGVIGLLSCSMLCNIVLCYVDACKYSEERSEIVRQESPIIKPDTESQLNNGTTNTSSKIKTAR